MLHCLIASPSIASFPHPSLAVDEAELIEWRRILLDCYYRSEVTIDDDLDDVFDRSAIHV